MNESWREQVVPPAEALKAIKPGMSIFLGSGVSEPRALVKHLLASRASNLQDLELVQLVSMGEALSPEELRSRELRLKTFFSGWVASDAIAAGRIDLIPSRFSRIPALFRSGRIPVDAAFVQITPPNEAGYCSLGLSVDVAVEAMRRASIVVGEINPKVPWTYGNTFVPLSDFDHLVESSEPPFCVDRWPVAEVFDRVAANVAEMIEDGSCLGFAVGPLFEALSEHLARKRDLGIHSPFITDALMDLIESGAVTNRNKQVFRGKSLVCYALGTPTLMAWLDQNPIVEFQDLEKVFDPAMIARNPNHISVMVGRKVDLSGRIALASGRGNVTELGDAYDYFSGADLSPGGRTIVALPSRSRRGESNIRLSVEGYPNLFSLRELVDMVVTEYGVAALAGRSVRERAQALIEVAHPDDRKRLVEEAKAARILFPDQVYLEASAHLYPAELATTQTFKNGVQVRFRAIKPSDEEAMRRLFYRFSQEAIYYRYFSPVKTMPHAKMQEYVNVDYRTTMCIVGLVDEPARRIVAEGRYVKLKDCPVADIAFVVDEGYQGLGVATFLLKYLIQIAKDRGIRKLVADVLASNKSMLKVFEKGDLPVRACLESGVYELEIDLEAEPGQGGRIQYQR